MNASDHAVSKLLQATERVRSAPVDEPPLQEFVIAKDELDASEAVGRWGTITDVPPGYELVCAIARFKFYDAGTGATNLMVPGQHFCIAKDRVQANVERGLIHRITHVQFDWWNAPGRILAAEPCDAVPLVTTPRANSLRIVSGVGYDPGAAAFRLHAALNETTQHASAFVRWGNTNPHCSLRQYDGLIDASHVRQAVHEADVIHNHVAYLLVNNTGVPPRADQLLVRHYHGSATTPGASHLEPALDRAKQALVLGARLQLVDEGKRQGLPMHWSPIPVPVARYRALRDAERATWHWEPIGDVPTTQRPLRIVHSPTNTRIKGTDTLRQAVRVLQSRGLPIELRMIERQSLGNALAMKALGDVCFDSFWLGIQGSGIEAGAMEMPVIAGDWDAAALYQDELGMIPYTMATDLDSLVAVLERFAGDRVFRETEAQRVSAYVEEVHDYRAVAARYERTIGTALGRDVSTEHTATNQLPIADELVAADGDWHTLSVVHEEGETTTYVDGKKTSKRRRK